MGPPVNVNIKYTLGLFGPTFRTFVILASQLLVLALCEIMIMFCLVKTYDYEINLSALFSIFQNKKKHQMCHLKQPVCTSLKIDRTCFATYLAGLCYTAATSHFISLGILDPITASVIWVQFMSVGYLPNPKSFFGSSLCLKKGVCSCTEYKFFLPITNSCFSNVCAFAFLQ